MAKTSEKVPWYKQPALVISGSALFFTLVTTITSGYRTYRQDVEARKAELRAIIQQLNAGAMQAVELWSKHQNDPLLPTFTSNLNVQNAIAAKQAYALVKDMGSAASPTDLNIVGYALTNIGDLARAEEMELMALERSTNSSDYLGATRQLGVIKMSTNQLAEAEVYWKRALAVFDKYPKETWNETNVHYTHAWTYLSWVGSSPQCQMALKQLAEADKEMGMLANVPQDLIQFRASIQCSTTASPVPATSFGAANPFDAIIGSSGPPARPGGGVITSAAPAKSKK